jgi:hypothetical protein
MNDLTRLIVYGVIAVAGLKLVRDAQGGTGPLADLLGPSDKTKKTDGGTDGTVPKPTPVGAAEFRLGAPNITWIQAANTLGGTVRVGHKGAGGLFSIILVPQSRDWLGVRVDRAPDIIFPTQYGNDADWYETIVDIPHTHIDEWTTFGLFNYCNGCDLVYRIVVRNDQDMSYVANEWYEKPITA